MPLITPPSTHALAANAAAIVGPLVDVLHVLRQSDLTGDEVRLLLVNGPGVATALTRLAEKLLRRPVPPDIHGH